MTGPNASLFLALLKREGLPSPLREYEFAAESHGRKWRGDYVWREQRVAMEVEGGAFVPGGGRHNRGWSFVKELDKYNAYAALGYRLFRVTPTQLCDLQTVRMLKQALLSPSASADRT